MESGGQQATKPKQDRPGVGIGVIILSEDGRILMGQRLSSGLYGFPGGHLERYETWEESGRRELFEETSIDIPAKDLKFVITNNIIDEKNDFHYVDVNLVGRLPKGQEAKNMEPTKCGGWEWWTIQEIERRSNEVFYPIRVLLERKHDIFNNEHLFSILNKESK